MLKEDIFKQNDIKFYIEVSKNLKTPIYNTIFVYLYGGKPFK